MTTNAEHAVRNQHMMMLALGLTAAKVLARNKTIAVIGLAALALIAHRRGAAASAALRRWAANNVAAWRHS
jgi:hypothetical protein